MAITWKAMNLPSSGSWRTGSWDGGASFVSLKSGSNESARSLNGLNWVAGGTLGTTAYWCQPVSSKHVIVVVPTYHMVTSGYTVYVFSKNGGVSWSMASLASFYTAAGFGWRSGCVGTYTDNQGKTIDRFVWVGYDIGSQDAKISSQALIIDFEGSTPYNENLVGLPAGYLWGNICYTRNGDNNWIYVISACGQTPYKGNDVFTDTKALAYSPDGLTWTVVPSALTVADKYTALRATPDGSQTIAIFGGAVGNTTIPKVATSSTPLIANSWITSALPASLVPDSLVSVQAVAYGLEGWAVLGFHTTVVGNVTHGASSKSGTVWGADVLPNSNASLLDVAYNESLHTYVATGTAIGVYSIVTTTQPPNLCPNGNCISKTLQLTKTVDGTSQVFNYNFYDAFTQGGVSFPGYGSDLESFQQLSSTVLDARATRLMRKVLEDTGAPDGALVSSGWLFASTNCVSTPTTQPPIPTDTEVRVEQCAWSYGRATLGYAMTSVTARVHFYLSDSSPTILKEFFMPTVTHTDAQTSFRASLGNPVDDLITTVTGIAVVRVRVTFEVTLSSTAYVKPQQDWNSLFPTFMLAVNATNWPADTSLGTNGLIFGALSMNAIYWEKVFRVPGGSMPLPYANTISVNIVTDPLKNVLYIDATQ